MQNTAGLRKFFLMNSLLRNLENPLEIQKPYLMMHYPISLFVSLASGNIEMSIFPIMTLAINILHQLC